MTRILLENVCVDFPIYNAQEFSLRGELAKRAAGGFIQRDSRQKDRIVVRALSEVNLRLEEGDRLGLVGHNGSGKSTLLKVLAGIYEPVAGRMTINGRVTPLFEMMPGLDPEDTGYENILTSGMLLGMSRSFIESKIPEIEEVSELGAFLSLPVRTYSLGMMTRLGFALVTALEPDVLIMDEGFGAADLRFTEKAAERMEDFIGRSKVMVLASHSDALLASICNKAAMLSEGRIVSVGPVEQVFDEYHFSVYGNRLKKGHAIEKEAKEEEEKPPVIYDPQDISKLGLENRLARTNGHVQFERFVCKDTQGELAWNFQPGESVRFEFEYQVRVQVPSLAVILRLVVMKDGVEFVVTDLLQTLSEGAMSQGARGSASASLSNITLRPGEFRIYASLVDRDNTIGFDVIDDNVSLPPVVIEKPPAEARAYLAGVVSIDFKLEEPGPVTKRKRSA